MKKIFSSKYISLILQSLLWISVLFFYALPNCSWDDWTNWQRVFFLLEFAVLILVLTYAPYIPFYFLNKKKYAPAVLSIIILFYLVNLFSEHTHYNLTRLIVHIEGNNYSLTFPHSHWFYHTQEIIYFLIFLFKVIALSYFRKNQIIVSNVMKHLKGLDLILFCFVWFTITLSDISDPSINGLLLFMRVLQKLVFGVVFYLNAFVLMQKFLKSKKLLKYALSVLLSLVVLLIGNTLPMLAWTEVSVEKFPFNKIIFDTNQILSNVFLIAVAIFARTLYDSALKHITTISQNKAELASLKAQINPHFLFNTLNTLYSSALQEKSPKTAESIAQLSDMMRYTVYDSTERNVGFKQELEFIENYISLQKKRIANDPNIEISVQFPRDTPNLKIAPMLFIPFIENAFKHGISYENPSFVTIQITTTIDSIGFIVENSSHKKKIKEDDFNSGIGLENTVKRLNLLYPDNHRLSIEETEGKYRIKLNLNKLISDV